MRHKDVLAAGDFFGYSCAAIQGWLVTSSSELNCTASQPARWGAIDHLGCIIEKQQRFGLQANACFDEIEKALMRFENADAGGIEKVLEQFGQAQMAPQSIGAQVLPHNLEQWLVESAVMAEPIVHHGHG